MQRIPVPPRLDLVVAAAVTVLAVSEVLTNAAISPTVPSLVIEVVIAAAVAWRRASPLPAAVVIATGVTLEAVIGVPPTEPALPPVASVIVLYSLVSYVELRRALAGSLILVAGATAQELIGGQPLSDLFFVYGLLGFAWAFGRIVRMRTNQAVEAELTVARIHREHEDERRRLAQQERARIARELHDVIAHSVSLMVVQVAAARRVLDQDPPAAERALDVVESTGRQAITELARLLGVLRDQPSGEHEELGLAPMPTMGQLPDLIRQVNQTGPHVTLAVHGRPRALQSGVELTAYRIIQEALTNTRKHGGPDCHATVTLDYQDARLTVDITDDGRQASGPGTGHGLVGIRERVETHHGTLRFGPVRGVDGFSVHVDLPLDGEQP